MPWIPWPISESRARPCTDRRPDANDNLPSLSSTFSSRGKLRKNANDMVPGAGSISREWELLLPYQLTHCNQCLAPLQCQLEFPLQSGLCYEWNWSGTPIILDCPRHCQAINGKKDSTRLEVPLKSGLYLNWSWSGTPVILDFPKH